MLPTIQIGPAALPTRPLIWLLAFYAGLWLAERVAVRRGLAGEALWNAGFLGLGGGLIGGRLAYVIGHWAAYRSDLGAIFSLRPGALSLEWALAIGCAVALLYLSRRGLLSVALADAAMPGLALALALISLGNLLSGDAYGIPSDAPWAIDLWEARRHPVQAYEALSLLAVLAVLWRRRSGAPPGQAIWILVLGYGLARWLWEPLRAESWLWPGGYRGWQVIGLVAAVAALWVLTRAAAAMPARAESVDPNIPTRVRPAPPHTSDRE